ncbi:MAG: hypothetical protein WC807_19245 [Hyphomicrobium sp.]|jgi:hypothetical protein
MLGHVDPELSARFARNCTDAAFGYARAASAAYAAMATQTIEFWAKAAERPDPSPASAPFSVKRASPAARDRSSREVTPLDFMLMANPWLRQDSAFASVTAWWSLFPLQGNPASWPMAYTMMTAGVPRDVALPTAEANIAAMEAAEIAKQTLENVFSTYRSDSGYATSQIIGPRSTIGSAAAFASLATVMMKWPWTLPGS